MEISSSRYRIDRTFLSYVTKCPGIEKKPPAAQFRMTTKTSPDRIQSQIEALELKLKQAKEKAKKLKAAQVAAAAKAERAKDTRRKILAGAVVLAKMDRGQLVQMLDTVLTRPDDRALFDLPPLGQEATQQSNG